MDICKRAGLIMFLFSLFLCVGCPSEDPPIESQKCNIHSDCSEGFFCVLGKCQTGEAPVPGSQEDTDAGEWDEPVMSDAGDPLQPTLDDAGTVLDFILLDGSIQNEPILLDAGIPISSVILDAGDPLQPVLNDAGTVLDVDLDAGHGMHGIDASAWDAGVNIAPVYSDGGVSVITSTIIVHANKVPVNGLLEWTNYGLSFGADEPIEWTYQYSIIGEDDGLDLTPTPIAISWTHVGSTQSVTIDLSLLSVGVWYEALVKGTRPSDSAQVTSRSGRFMKCPQNYIFVPSNEDLFEEAKPFCVAQFEMKLSDNDEGNDACTCDNYTGVECTATSCQGPLASRPGGTPINYVTATSALELCESIGPSYHLLSNEQWQLIARNIENQGINWSGGSVGSGAINQGHSDGDPLESLPVSDINNPCTDTGNLDCTNRNHSDYSQKRTHILSNGATLWDFSGNLSERVADSAGISNELLEFWQPFSGPIFTTSIGAEEHRRTYGPEGDYDETHGMGRFYVGETNVVRGGDYALELLNIGIYSTHHKRWHTRRSDGLRCVLQP